MNSKKTIAGLSALSVLISSGAFTAMTAFAADTAEYTTGKMTAHLYSDEKLKEIECRYYNDMPNVPYIKLSDYYSCWLCQYPDQELAITNKNDGTYEVKMPIGATGIIDTNKDTVSTDDAAGFLYPQYILESNGENIFTYVKGDSSAEEDEDEKVSYTQDFYVYDIDIRGDEKDIWWPATTLCDFYEYSLNQGAVIDNELYFFPQILSTYSRTALAGTPEHTAAFIEKYKNGRPKDMIEYNYNELCFCFDRNYGFPGRFKYNELLEENGFDKMLSTASDGTKKIKELLLSEDLYDYCAGYEMLNDYLWDGGHTVFTDFMLQNSKDLASAVSAKFQTIAMPEDAFDHYAVLNNSNNSGYTALKTREEMYKTADTYEKGNGSEYSVKGDTAFFAFNFFEDNTAGWYNYYFNNGELPQDVVSEFYNSIKKADADPAVKNFVIDLSTNGGGSLSIVQYMMGLINDLDNVTVVMNGKTENAKFVIDKNLDKAYDDKDKAFKTDLRFGIITSNYSFSCANLMPSLAKDAGIMLIGERSGGGTCATNRYFTPDGLLYALSTGLKFVDKDGNTIDDGIVPDYDIVKKNADGTKDYSDVYNYSKLSALFDEFYGKKTDSSQSTSTTTTTTTTTTTSSTTTTSATTTTAASSTSTSSSAASTTSGSTTTTTNVSTLPQTGNKSAAAACAAVLVMAGGAFMLMSRKKEN